MFIVTEYAALSHWIFTLFFQQFNIEARDAGGRTDEFQCSYEVIRNTRQDPTFNNLVFVTTINETHDFVTPVFELDAADPDAQVNILGWSPTLSPNNKWCQSNQFTPTWDTWIGQYGNWWTWSLC